MPTLHAERMPPEVEGHSRELDHLRATEQFVTLDRRHTGGLLDIIRQSSQHLHIQNLLHSGHNPIHTLVMQDAIGGALLWPKVRVEGPD